MVTEFTGKRAWAPKTLPVLRWQARQWQTEIRSGSAEVIADSWPQEQEAVCTGIEGVRRGVAANSDAFLALEVRGAMPIEASDVQPDHLHECNMREGISAVCSAVYTESCVELAGRVSDP
jgi:hypothetical protein